MPASSPAIRTQNLEVRRGDNLALRELDLAVDAGATLAVIGPNGSGKSTLLGALAGIHPPSSGSFEVRGGTPALVLQSTDVDKSMPITVEDTIGLARYPSLGLFKRFTRDDREIVAESMRRMQIGDLAGRQLHDLSGGQRQRVLVAQGLAQGAEVLLLDEPVTGLDVTSRQLILDVVDEEARKGTTVVVTTHHLDDARFCDHVLLLDGAAIAFGTPEEVLTADLLRRGFGGAVARVGEELILDDAHHHHHH